MPNGIWFNHQSEIDNFQINFPNCTEIQGDVTLWGNGINNLNGLIVLTSIGGDLDITSNPSLTSLTGLDNLTSIGGQLLIQSNDSLTSLTGMENLASIGGRLAIFDNYSLTSLMGLDNLTYIGGDLIIIHNTPLTNLTGLYSLMSIGGELVIGTNHSLTSLTGLDNINEGSITNLYITFNYLLSTCAVQSICNYLAAPNGIVEFNHNVTGCNNVEEVEAECGVGLEESSVDSNQALVDICPNPASSLITISTPATPNKNTFLTIFNINGQALLSRQIMESQTVVDVAGLSQGVYYVRVISDNGVQVGKFVKQ